MSDLNTLASNLKSQVSKSSSIVLDGTIFKDQVLTNICLSLSLPSGTNLTITGLKASDIPSPANNELVISAGVTTALGQANLSVDLVFTVVKENVEVIISLKMNAEWKFSDSFKGLDIFPFNVLKVSTPYLVYSTLAQTSFSWPDDVKTKIALSDGLNFLSNVILSNFSVIGTLLGSLVSSDPIKFYGAFSPLAGEQLPVGTIKAPLSAGDFSIGVAPNAISLSDPTIAVRIDAVNEDISPVQNVDLLIEATYNKTLEVAIGIPAAGTTVDLSTAPLPNKDSINSLIESLPGGAGFTNFIPSELSTVFSAVGLDNFSMIVNGTPSVTYLSLAISTIKPWVVIKDVLTLEGLGLQIEIIEPTGLNWKRVFIEANAKFLPHIFKGEFDFNIGLKKELSWEISEVNGLYNGGVSLGDIVEGLLSSKSSVPDSLQEIIFSDFGVTVTRPSASDPFNYVFYGGIETAFPILGTQLTAQLYVTVTKDPSGYGIALTGAFVIGNQVFGLTLDLATEDSKMKATWSVQGHDYLELEDIASAFNLSMPDIPKGLDLGLESASLTYDFTDSTLVIEATSVNYGNAVFVAFKNTTTTKWQFYFGLLIGKSINLSNLPLIDKVLSKDEKIEVDDLQVLVTSAPLDPSKEEDEKEIANINKLIGSDYPFIPEQGLLSTVAVSLQFDFGGLIFPISVSTPKKTADSTTNIINVTNSTELSIVNEPALGSPKGVNTGSIPKPKQTADGATWFNVQKNFGPVNFQKIGVKYSDGVLQFLLDASLTAAGLEISVIGLSVGTPLNTFEPEFNIEGLGVSYSNAGVIIGGAFEKQPVEAPVTLEFSGLATIQLEEFGISAVGSYAQISNQTSMFVFASIEGAFGGPGFFFVTGLSGGFGYNSKLRIPTQNEIYQFPFIASLSDPNVLGSDPTPAEVLEEISGGDNPWVTPSVGDVWLSAGVTFTTYEIVNSTAMIVAEFGNKLILSLLGLSSARFPMEGPEVYAYVELQLAATFDPGDGEVSFSAVLSPNSYVLDKACHLTGGFALCFWYGPSQYAGDFVLTLGGYSPYFSPPSHYPQEPRLGFSWSLDSSISISGGLYFAMTPAAVMAGGSLQAVYHTGNLRAWFKAYADIIIWYNPFHFKADIGINVGASYKVDFLFCTKTFTVELGADLTLWGPTTGGKARIHWFIISFTIDFGAAESTGLEKQTWAEFSKILPASKDVVKITPLTGLATGTAPTTKSKTEAAQVESKSSPWLVRADNFQFTTNSTVPITALYIDGNTTALKSGSPINIKPMQAAELTSKKTLSVINKETGKNVLDNTWSVEFISNNVPESLWGTGDNKKLPEGSQLIQNQLSGFQIKVPSPVLGTGTGNMSIKEDLQYDPLTSGVSPLKLGLTPQGLVPTASDSTITDIAQIMSAPVKAQRDSIFNTLSLLMDTVDLVNGDLTTIATNAGALFTDEPLLTESK